uniref:Uncharacterized protein n=1 Tax=Kalanchoe fedtschenkoi TaxID=63787 RepID=A0A7N0UCR9_KALFE
MAQSGHSSTNSRDVSGSTAESKPPFSEDEKDLVMRMYKLVGKRWSLIAGRIPGRTAEEIKAYWKNNHSNRN